MMSSTNYYQYKLISATNLIIFLLLIPKINIINFEGYHQGIRIENLISLVLLFIILFNLKNFELNNGLKFYLFCSIIFLSYLVGSISNVTTLTVTILRLFEYLVFIVFFTNFKLDYKKIIIFFKLLIIINFIVSILQYYEILGFISSIGYIKSDFSLWRSAGIFSGSWELSFITSITYFIIYHNDKKKINIYLFITLVILYLAGTRGILIPFIFSVLFLYIGNFKFRLIYAIIIPTIVSVLYFFITKYFGISFITLANSIIKLVFFSENILQIDENLIAVYYSWAYRIENWVIFANIFNTNLFTVLFGSGYTSIYYESIFARILFANGIIGLVILCILSLRIKFYMIIFLLLSGLTIDFVASFKMFIILFLYFQCLKIR